MKVFYRGFEGEMVYDIDRGLVYITGRHQDGHRAIGEGQASLCGQGDAIREFKKSADMCLDGEEG